MAIKSKKQQQQNILYNKKKSLKHIAVDDKSVGTNWF